VLEKQYALLFLAFMTYFFYYEIFLLFLPSLKKNSIFLKCGELAADQDLKTSFSWLKSNGESLGIKARGLRGREFPEKKASQC